MTWLLAETHILHIMVFYTKKKHKTKISIAYYVAYGILNQLYILFLNVGL